MPHLDPRVLHARGERAWVRKRGWYGLLVDVWNLCAPGLSPYMTGSGAPETMGGMPPGSQGQPRAQLLYDSTLAGAIEDHANFIKDSMFPAGRDWGELSAGPLLGEGQESMAVERALAKTKERLYAEIHASNFQLAAAMMIFDACVSGTGCMKVGASRDASTFLDFEAVNQAQVAFEPGARHAVWGYYRKMSETREMIRVLWPDAELPEMRDSDLTSEGAPRYHDLLECTTYQPDEGVWHYDVLMRADAAGITRIFEREYVVSPWVVWRYMLHAGEVQGRSRAMTAAPHARVANHAIRVRLKSASIRVGGMFTFTGDDVFNPDAAHFETGGFIQVGSNDSTNPTIRVLELPGDPQLGEIVLADERQVIRERTLTENLPPVEAGIRSATEWLKRDAAHTRRIGSPFQRLIEEAGRPLLRATAYIMAEGRQLPELAAIRPPAEGQLTAPPLMLNGKDVKVVFHTPAGQAQRLADVENMVRFGEMAPVVAGGDATAVQSTIKTEESVAILAEKMHYPPEAIYSEEERAARAEDARQMAMEQATAAGAGPGPGPAPSPMGMAA